MTWTEVGKSGTMLLFGPSGGQYPNYMELDLGSQSVTAQTSGVSSAAFSRAIDTYDQSIVKEITDTANWNSVELSGTTVYGFGLKAGSVTSGADWVVVNFAQTGSIVFDGTKELQIQVKLRHP